MTYNQTYYPQIELGSTATEYEPYARTAYPIGRDLYQWDTKDMVSGAVSVGHGIKVLDGTERWSSYSHQEYRPTGTYCYFIENSLYAIGSNTSICTHFNNVSMAWRYGNVGEYSDHPTSTWKMFISDKVSVADFKSWLAAQYAAGTPVTVLYQLATPTAATDTATDIPTPNGNMVVSSDSAVAPTLDIKYIQDSTIVISRLKATIVALGGNV